MKRALVACGCIFFLFGLRDPFHRGSRIDERIPRVEGICTVQEVHYALVVYGQQTHAMQEGQVLDTQWRIVAIEDEQIIFEHIEQRCHYPVKIRQST